MWEGLPRSDPPPEHLPATPLDFPFQDWNRARPPGREPRPSRASRITGTEASASTFYRPPITGDRSSGMWLKRSQRPGAPCRPPNRCGALQSVVTERPLAVSLPRTRYGHRSARRLVFIKPSTVNEPTRVVLPGWSGVLLERFLKVFSDSAHEVPAEFGRLASSNRKLLLGDTTNPRCTPLWIERTPQVWGYRFRAGKWLQAHLFWLTATRIYFERFTLSRI